jgi:NADH-quinone oxidoreductase subunit N
VELDVRLLIPEIILLAAACLCTLLGLSRSDKVRRSTQLLAALACAGAFLAATMAPSGYVRISPFNPDYITMLAAVIGFLSVLVAWDMPSKADPSTPDAGYRGEFFGMMLFSLAGVSMIGKVNDLIWLFVALELVSIPTYILVATGRSQIIAQEAGVKYFFLGALAAAIYLFGFSYIYGAAGSTRFDDITNYFNMSRGVSGPGGMSWLALIGLLMMIVGISYKIAAVPLHFYAPDVYQGAATPVTAFLAFAPKAAGMVAIISILSFFNFDYTMPGGRAVMALLSVVAILTMTVGNVLALLQRNIKRMFAYSSIAHSGYMLVGLVAMAPGDDLGRDGVSATLFYLTSYAIMNLGAFAALIYFQGKADAAEDLDDIAGIAKSFPLAALMMSVCLFSLIGMPLTMGFLGKFYLIQRALVTGHSGLAVVTVINAAIAAAYYLKIIAAMYLREPLYPFFVRKAMPVKVALMICTVGVIAFFFAPGYLFHANNMVDAEPQAMNLLDRPARAATPAGRGAAGRGAAGRGAPANRGGRGRGGRGRGPASAPPAGQAATAPTL